MTANLPAGTNAVYSWQDFTIATYASGSQQAASSCQSWKNGTATATNDGEEATAHIVADCADDELHVDVTVMYILPST